MHRLIVALLLLEHGFSFQCGNQKYNRYHAKISMVDGLKGTNYM